MTLSEIADSVRQQRKSAAELLEEHLNRVSEGDDELNCFLTLSSDLAREQAVEIDAAVRRGDDPGPLAGVPIALKDNICVRGLTTTCGSKILENFVPPYDATVWSRLRAAGAVLVGKTNLDEYAMGSSTENSAFGPTLNPWDRERVPGGSSGGSAAAVAAGFVPVALGSDTGGSIRQPAAFCGVTGLKPTYGRVSRYGLVAYASSLDQIGPLAATSLDCAQLLSVIAGHDPMDSTSNVEPYAGWNGEEMPAPTLGVPDEVVAKLSEPMREAFEQSLAEAEKAGAKRVSVTLETLDYSLAAYYVIATAEASSNLARYDGVRYGLRAQSEGPVEEMMSATRAAGFGPEVKRRIMLGTYALSSGYYDAYYLKAQKARTVLRNDLARAFQSCDLLALPATPSPAFKLGEKTDDPMEMYLSDVFTVMANLTGMPALVCPAPKVNGLPTGLQFMGPAWSEARLLAFGHAYQQVSEHHLGLPAAARN